MDLTKASKYIALLLRHKPEEGDLTLDKEGYCPTNDLVKALNAIGVAPIDLISILQALKKAGSLQAELVII